MFFYTNNFASHCFFKGIAFAVTDRFGGVSKAPYDALNLALHVGDNPAAVAQNRACVLNEFNAYASTSANAIHYLNQVHGDKLAFLESAPKTEFLGKGDGIITAVHGVLAMVMVADCAPMLLYDADFVGKDGKSGAFALLHIGRAGALKKLITKAAREMKTRFGSTHISAFVGPHIKKCCYEVGDGVAAQVREIYATSAESYLLASNFCCSKLESAPKDSSLNLESAPKDSSLSLAEPKFYLDLEKMIVDELLENNITNHQVMPYCTHLDALYSYRQSPATGRFGLLAMLV